MRQPLAGPAAALAPGASRMCDLCTPDTLLEAVRGLRVADPELGFKPLLAKLQQQQPDLGAATKEVREALAALKAEGEAAKAAAVAPPAAKEGGTPSSAAGRAAAALAASPSAFSAIIASRTSLVAAPRSGCCSRREKGIRHSPCHRHERVITNERSATGGYKERKGAAHLELYSSEFIRDAWR